MKLKIALKDPDGVYESIQKAKQPTPGTTAPPSPFSNNPWGYTNRNSGCNRAIGFYRGEDFQQMNQSFQFSVLGVALLTSPAVHAR